MFQKMTTVPSGDIPKTMWQSRRGWKSHLQAAWGLRGQSAGPLVSVGFRCRKAAVRPQSGGDAEEGCTEALKSPEPAMRLQGLEPFTQGRRGFSTSWGCNPLATLKEFSQTDEMSSLRTSKEISYFCFWCLTCWMADCMKHRKDLNTV